MKNLQLVLLIASLTLVGCSTPADKLIPLPGYDELSTDDVTEASLAPGTEILTEPLISNSTDIPQKYTTGSIWARIFVGQGAAAPATLVLLSTRLSEKVDAKGTRRVTYDVKARLSVDDKTFPLHASATRSSAESGDAAMRRAVEAVVVDVARQAKVIEKKIHPGFLPE